MYRIIVIFSVVICCTNAGIIAGGLGHGAVIAAAPVAVASAHVAESYQNNNLLALHPTAVVATHAVPAVAKVAVAPAPVVVSHGIGLGHGFLH